MGNEMCEATAVKQNCIGIISELFVEKDKLQEKLKPILIDEMEDDNKTLEPNNSNLIRDLEKLLTEMRRLSGRIDL